MASKRNDILVKFLVLFGAVSTQGFAFPEEYSEVSTPWNEAVNYRPVRDTLLREKIMRDGYADIKVPKYMLLQYSNPKTSKALLNDIPDSQVDDDLALDNRDSKDSKPVEVAQSQGNNPVLSSLAINPLGFPTIVSLLGGGSQLPILPISLAMPLASQTANQLYNPYPLTFPLNTVQTFPQYPISVPLNQPLTGPFSDMAGRSINNGVYPFFNSPQPGFNNPGVPFNMPNYQAPNSNYQVPTQNFQFPNQNFQSPLRTFNPWLQGQRPGFPGPYNGNMYPMGNFMNNSPRYPYPQMAQRDDDEK